jgi:hypothetical protein
VLMARSPALIIATLFLSTVSTVTGFMVMPTGFLSPLAGPALLGATGGIVGSISIGPVFPVCRGYPTTAPAPPYYNQIGVLVTPSSGLPLTVPVIWVLVNDCSVNGTFRIGLNPGEYSLTLTSCISQPNSFGCSQLPITAVVASRAWTQVKISVTTGIE